MLNTVPQSADFFFENLQGKTIHVLICELIVFF
jgi:hypothetical protein